MRAHRGADANEATICHIKHTHAVSPDEKTLVDKEASRDVRSKRFLINEEMNEVIEIPLEGLMRRRRCHPMS